MKGKLQAASGGHDAKRNARLRAKVIAANTGDRIEDVMTELKLLPAVDLRHVLMYSNPEPEAMTAFQKWPGGLRAGSVLMYLDLLRTLKLTAVEVQQTHLIRMLELLTDSTDMPEAKAAALRLNKHWRRLPQRSQR